MPWDVRRGSGQFMMSSNFDNPTGTRSLWRGRWMIRAAVLLLIFVFGRRGTEQPAGTPPEQRTPTITTVTPAHGNLTQVRPGVFESTAGLIYGPGGSEGHRIDHIMRHTDDDPARPVHGVFDGDREEILALLDDAYRLALERGPPVQVERDGARTVYTIDMKRRVGFVGGETGRRDGHPDATHIRLVLEDRNVITAFPVRP